MATVTLTCGLGFGDEGKGTTIDSLARRAGARLVVRYNGGAQAAHNVVSGERHHTFAQWGAGTFAGLPTLLSRHVLVNPISALAEARSLREKGVASPLSMLHVERGAVVTTPFHVAMNRLREMSRTLRHGSCGMGIGETMQDVVAKMPDVLRISDLEEPARVRRVLHAVRARKLEEARALGLFASRSENEAIAREARLLEDPDAVELAAARYAAFAEEARLVGPEYLERELRAEGQVLFEGAQGVLLDQDMGFAPHTTWTDITFANARELLGSFRGEVVRLGILRAYTTRHGAGPMVTASSEWDALSRHDHNAWGEWQGSFRSGPLDLVATRYALAVAGGVDGLVVTNVDRLALLGERVPVCTAYEGPRDAALFDDAGEIRVVRPFDLAHQEQLGAAMFRVRPRLEILAREGYAESVAERLGVRLAGTSFGPRAEEKRWVERA